MTIEHSDDSGRPRVNDPAEQSAAEQFAESAGSAADNGVAEVAPSPDAPEPTPGSVIHVAEVRGLESAEGVQHDSAPPVSRKLAPPPKPKRESGMTSRPPSVRPSGAPAELSPESSAFKAPLAPNIAYAGVPPGSFPPIGESPAAPLVSQVARPSNASTATQRSGSEPSITVASPDDTQKLSSSAPHPIASPPRPSSDRPSPRAESDEPARESASAPARSPSSSPPSSSAIFAMRIIAVGESARPPAAQEQAADLPPDAYPPSGSRLGTGVRRSSRPAIRVQTASEPNLTTSTPLPLAQVPSAPALPSDFVRHDEMDVPIDVELPPGDSAVPAAEPAPSVGHFAEMLPPPLGSPSEPASELRPPPVELRPPPPPPPEELGEADLSPDSEQTTSATLNEAEELGREDAISMPPEEVAAVEAEQAKSEAAKPPPPPKRSAGVAASGPPSIEPSASSASAAGAPPASSAPATPPTPDLAAAKAAQRSKTRQPWWEDLFSEDFMRASSRVSDEQVRREVTFIEESLGVAAGGVVLDLGCGTGHHAVEFASRGYGVVGYDLSLYQLALAADVAQERNQKINFLQGDMREMAFEEMFDGVFCWNTTFGYFEEDKNLAVAQRVFRALRPGGMFLIDVLNRDFAAASAPCTVWYEGDACVCMDDMSVDYISSRLRVKRSIILDDGRTKESLFSLRLYSLHELGKLLHEVGFRVTEASGHPATPGVFFGPNSPRIIMLAQRP